MTIYTPSHYEQVYTHKQQLEYKCNCASCMGVKFTQEELDAIKETAIRMELDDT